MEFVAICLQNFNNKEYLVKNKLYFNFVVALKGMYINYKEKIKWNA